MLHYSKYDLPFWTFSLTKNLWPNLKPKSLKFMPNFKTESFRSWLNDHTIFYTHIIWKTLLPPIKFFEAKVVSTPSKITTCIDFQGTSTLKVNLWICRSITLAVSLPFQHLLLVIWFHFEHYQISNAQQHYLFWFRLLLK